MNILWVNLHKYPLNMPVVRQAISMTINRTAMANISWSGYSPAVTNLTGVTPGMMSTWSTPALAKKYKVVYDPTAAKKMLLKAGFKMGDNGTLLTPKGDNAQYLHRRADALFGRCGRLATDLAGTQADWDQRQAAGQLKKRVLQQTAVGAVRHRRFLVAMGSESVLYALSEHVSDVFRPVWQVRH